MSVPPPNVKVYDRPESKGPKALVIVVALLVVVIVGFFVYRAMHHAPVAAANAQPGLFSTASFVQTEVFQGSLPSALGAKQTFSPRWDVYS